MTTAFGSGYKMESGEARALRSINTESYDYRDQGKLLTKLTSDVSYMAQYMRNMQQGIDEANQNFIQQIGDFISEIVVVIGGGGNTGFDLGDLKYLLQAVGALFGFDQQTGLASIFPINLVSAAWHFFSTYILPIGSFGDAIDNFIDSAIATILDVLGEIPIVGQAVQILATWISDFRDGVNSIGNAINNTITNLGNLITDLWQNPGAVISSIGQNMVTGLTTALDNINNFIQDLIDKIIRGLTGIPIIGGAIAAIVNGFESLFDNLFRQPTPKNTVATAAVPALDAAKITSGSFAEAQIPSLDGSKIGTGSVAAARIAALDASKIETGSFGSSRITDGSINNNKLGNDISGDKIVVGTVGAARIDVLDASKITSGTLGNGVIPNITRGMSTDLQSTIDNMYVNWYGTTGTGTTADVSSTISSIKNKTSGVWNVQIITTSGTWTRPWSSGSIDTPKEFWAICIGGGNGGQSARPDGTTYTQKGGAGGGYISQQINISDIPATVSVTIGVGGAGGVAGGSTSPYQTDPGSGTATTFGSLATSLTTQSAIASLFGYYDASSSTPGSGGRGAGAAGRAAVAGSATPLASGGTAGTGSVAAGAGGTASLTGQTRCGGGGGGGGGALTTGAGGVGGAGGFPGGGGGGGGYNYVPTNPVYYSGGAGANGVLVLLWQ